MSKSIRFLWLIFKDPQLCKLCNYYFNTKQISANIQTPHLKFRQGWWNICKKILLQTKSCSEFQSESCWISNGAAVEHNIAMQKNCKSSIATVTAYFPKIFAIFKSSETYTNIIWIDKFCAYTTMWERKRKQLENLLKKKQSKQFHLMMVRGWEKEVGRPDLLKRGGGISKGWAPIITRNSL